MIFAVILVMYAAFFSYLLMVGAGLRRSFGVVRISLLYAIAGGALLAFLPSLYFPRIGEAVFLGVAAFMSFFALTFAATARARDYVVPDASTFEIVCINVFMVALGGPPKNLEYFGEVAKFAYDVLLVPFSYLVPEDLAWLSMLMALWPSALALLMVARGSGNRPLRLLLMWWLQVIGILWILPSAFETLVDGGREMRFGLPAMLLAAIGLVRIWLAAIALREAVFGKLDTSDYDAVGEAGRRPEPTRGLIDRMAVLMMPAWVYLSGAAVAFLLASITRHFFDDAQSITSGYFVILWLSSLGTRLAPVLGRARARGARFVVSFGLLFVLVLSLRVVQPLPPRQPPYGPAPDRAVRSLADFVPLRVDVLAPDVTAPCMVERGAPPATVQCGENRWELASLRNRQFDQAPFRVGASGEAYVLTIGNQQWICQEFEIVRRGATSADVLMLVQAPAVRRRDDVAWIATGRVRCPDLAAARVRDPATGDAVIVAPRTTDRSVTNTTPQDLLVLELVPTAVGEPR
jgi:hypothetical protein